MRELCSQLLWTDIRPMRFLGVPVGRRCAVARSADGALVLFSPVAADAQSLADLQSLGEVATVVLPSRFHDRFYDGYFSVFPHARFLAAEPVRRDHPTWPLAELTEHAPELDGFDFLELRGMPAIREWVFLHRASRTLIVADALFALRPGATSLDRMLLLAAGVGERPRPCRLFRLLIHDRKAFADSLRKVLTWDFDRIVAGHGEVIESGGQAVLQSAYERYLT